MTLPQCDNVANFLVPLYTDGPGNHVLAEKVIRSLFLVNLFLVYIYLVHFVIFEISIFFYTSNDLFQERNIFSHKRTENGFSMMVNNLKGVNVQCTVYSVYCTLFSTKKCCKSAVCKKNTVIRCR